MFAPVVTRFHSFAVTLDEASSTYCAAVRAWPAMEEWAAAAADEPWIVDYAEF
jgi:glutathione S-transferase